MKNLLFVMLLLAMLAACKKDGGDASVVFYTPTSTHGDVDVYIEGKYEGTISRALSGTPSCGSSSSDKVLAVNLAPGTYRWGALGEDGSVAGASFTVEATGCRIQMIP